MAGIILKNSDQEFDLDGYLKDNGLEMVGEHPKSALNYFRNRGNVAYTVKDSSGKEFDFDAHKFLRDNGMEPDLDATLAREQKQSEDAADKADALKNKASDAELQAIGLGEAVKKIAAPNTYELQRSGKIDEPTRAGLSGVADVLGFLPRGAVGLWDQLKHEMTGGKSGMDMETSMAQPNDYGKAGENPSISDGFKSLSAAFRVSPGRVAKDMLYNMARDPVTGATALLALGGNAPAAAGEEALTGGRFGALMAQIGEKYKPMSGVLSGLEKPARVMAKISDKINQAGVVAQTARDITGNAALMGSEGVAMKYAQGQDQEAWDTFVTSAVNQGGIDMLLSTLKIPFSAAWGIGRKTAAVNEFRAQETGKSNVPMVPPERWERAPQGPQGPDFPEYTVMPDNPKDAPSMATKNPDPMNSTVTPMGLVPKSDALPPGLSQQEAVKMSADPTYKPTWQIAAENTAREHQQAVHKDVKLLMNDYTAKQKQAQTTVQNAMHESIKEVEKEDAQAKDQADKEMAELKSHAMAILDPTKPTPFDSYHSLFGHAFQKPEDVAKAYEEFHVEEQKKIKAIRERISPPEGGAAPAPAEPADKGYIENGGQNDEAVHPGNGSGAERTPGLDGGEAGQGAVLPGENRGAGNGQLGDGLENGIVSELPRESRDPRPVNTEEDLLPPVHQAKKAERDAQAENDPEYRPVRAAAWENIDLRKKSPIELSRSKRVEMNQHGKEVLEQFETDPSSLTDSGREVLRHYTGQGGLGTKADEDATSGILNQHYTSYPVVKFAWDALGATGFPMDKRLTALEPTAGIGNFIGHKPDNVDFHANEVDKTSAQVLKALYPQNITNREGPFESYYGPKVDIAITNVPFLSDRGAYEHLETDPKYKGIRSLHNYIMMKSIDQLHDNGMGIFITSTGTMDAKTGAEFRKQFNQKAEILGAFRLPEGTFDKNTQYKGTVDMIVVRKRTRGEIASVLPEDRIQKEWVDTKEINVKSQYGEGKANQSVWYEKHPEGVLGEFVYGHNRHLSQTGVQLKLDQGEDLNMGLKRVFNKALEALQNKYVPAPGAEVDPNLSGVGESVGRASVETPVFGLEVKDGKVFRKARDGELRAFRPEANPKGKPWDVPESRFVLLTKIMAAAQQLKEETGKGNEVGFLQDHIKSMLNEWKAMPKYPRQSMDKGKNPVFPGVKMTRRTVGDSHVMDVKFGDSALDAFAGQDKRYNLLAGLYDKKLTGFSRTLTDKPAFREPPSVPRGDMAKGTDVVKYLIDKYGVFQDAMARQEFKGTPEEYHAAMMENPAVNWDNGEFVHDYEYLQGDIRDKMEYAKKMGLSHQLKKLEAVLPEQKTGHTVQANPIATWWDPEALTAFARSKGILGQGYSIGRAMEGTKEGFHVLQGEKIIDGSRSKELNEFVETVLNQRPVKMDDPSGATNSKGDAIRVSDHAGSKKIKDKWNGDFDLWAKGAGKEHAERAAVHFNRDYASISTGKEIETPLFIEGMSTKLDGRDVKFYPSQMSLVRRGVRLGGYIAAHGVGHGKTIGLIATHAELRNKGMTKKALYVVPSKNRGMWHSNIVQLMPGTEVKIISSDGHQKRIDLVDAANNHYDAILVSYDTFKTIPLGKAEAYIREDIAKFKEAETKLRATGKGGMLTNGQLKRLEEKVAKLENKLAQMQTDMKDPQGVTTFEDLGADTMFLDEAHTVKNSFEQMNEYADRPFLNKSTDSTVGNDMAYKSRFLHERNGRGGMFLATATPTPNNPLEIYKIIKLVAPHEWTTRGINSSDDFIRNFVTIGPIDTPEMDGTTASANVKPREGITGWQNLNALRSILNKWMDFRKDNADVKKPESLAIPTYVDMNDEQLNGMARILVLSELGRREQAKAGVNMASLTMNAKVLAIDPAFSDPSLLESKPNFTDRSPKLREAMKNVAKHFKASPDRNQIVFLDFFNIGEYKAITDDNGLPMAWPQGFGDLGANEDGEKIEPEWLGDLEEKDKAKMRALMVPDKGAVWPRRFLDAAGRPIKVTESTIKQYRPEFDADGNVSIKVQHIKENLHNSIARYAVEKLGMDPQRVMVVNGGENGRPEDKTRIEQMVADGLLSLIVGNKPSVGEGLNLQNRGDAMHHIDVPWTPKELEQANGRMWRPRHEAEDNHPVSIYNYVAKGSLDAKGYAVLGQKEKWQQELFTGHTDFMDNTLNNLEKTGFSYKDMSESAAVNPEYVAGYRLGAKVSEDESNLVAAQKEVERKTRAIEVQKNAYAEATRKTENAQKNLQEGQEKAEKEGKPYESGAYWQKIIDNNKTALESGLKIISEMEEGLKPYEQVPANIETNNRAKAMVKVARANKWKTLGGKLEGPRAEAYRTMLQKVMPEINTRYPALADMMAAKAFGGKLPEDLGAAEESLLAYLAGLEKNSQAGKASPMLLGGVVATGVLASTFGVANTIALVGGASAAVYGYKRLARSDWFQKGTWSIQARLRQLPSFRPIEPRFAQAYHLANTNIARTAHVLGEVLKPLSEEERLQVPDKVENPDLQVSPAVERAANVWRKVAETIAVQAKKVGFGMMPDPKYYPRSLDFERLQLMKEDPELMDRNVQHLMKTQGLSMEDAQGLLMNFFDNTDEMRMATAAKRKKEMIDAIRRRHPNISDQELVRAYMRMKNQYGEMLNGNLRFQRKVPMLLPEMYIRDPADVLPRYLETTWKAVSYRKMFGPNLDMIRDFLDTEFPILGEKPSPEREEAEDFLDTELYRNKFSSRIVADTKRAQEVAGTMTGYQVWTKLFTSVLAPARNIAFGTNMSIPIAGGRNTLKGMIEVLRKGRNGFKNARVAGAISERVIRDAFESSKGNDKTAFSRFKENVSYWHPQSVTERFIRAFSFHAGQYRGESLFRDAMTGNKRAIHDLTEALGENRLAEDMAAGRFSNAARDLFGLSMSEDIAGSTRPLRLPRWMNTPEGAVLFQFRRIAFDQTRVLKDKVLIPATRGEFGPLLKWGAAVGVSSYIMATLASMLYGDDKKKKKPSGAGQEAWAFVEYLNNVNALGLYGDVSLGLNSGDDYGDAPLVGTMLGPTLSSVLHAAKDILWDAPHKNDAGEELKQIAKREIPFLGKLAKWGVPGFEELNAAKK